MLILFSFFPLPLQLCDACLSVNIKCTRSMCEIQSWIKSSTTWTNWVFFSVISGTRESKWVVGGLGGRWAEWQVGWVAGGLGGSWTGWQVGWVTGGLGDRWFYSVRCRLLVTASAHRMARRGDRWFVGRTNLLQRCEDASKNGEIGLFF